MKWIGLATFATIVLLAFPGRSQVAPGDAVDSIFPSPRTPSPEAAATEALLKGLDSRLKAVESRLGQSSRSPTLSYNFERRMTEIERRLDRLEQQLKSVQQMEQRIRKLEAAK